MKTQLGMSLIHHRKEIIHWIIAHEVKGNKIKRKVDKYKKNLKFSEIFFNIFDVAVYKLCSILLTMLFQEFYNSRK